MVQIVPGLSLGQEKRPKIAAFRTWISAEVERVRDALQAMMVARLGVRDTALTLEHA